jgi:hypothetical protein
MANSNSHRKWTDDSHKVEAIQNNEITRGHIYIELKLLFKYSMPVYGRHLYQDEDAPLLFDRIMQKLYSIMRVIF